MANVLYAGNSSSNLPLSTSDPNIAFHLADYFSQAEFLEVISNSTSRKSSSSPRSELRIELDEPLTCESGSGRLTGSLDETTGTGSLTFTFISCLIEGFSFDGTGSFEIHQFDFSLLSPVDTTISFELMTLSSPDFDGSMKGSIRIENLYWTNTEKITLNYIIKDNHSEKMYEYKDMIITTIFDNYWSPTSKTQSFTGAPARAYDSIHGFIEIETLIPMTFSSNTLTHPDTNGIIMFSGANETKIRVTVLTVQQVQFELDIDASPGYEKSHTLFWDKLEFNTNHDLTGMDSVQVLRVPLGGGSLTGLNSNSYIGQTFKLQQPATIEKLTVFIANSSNIDFRILLVDVDETPVPHPTNVLFESNTISLPGIYKPSPVTVDFVGISLNADQTYAWILDGYIEYDGIYQHAQISVNSPNPFPDGSIIYTNSPSSHTNTREENFNDFWYESTQNDMSFVLEYNLN